MFFQILLFVLNLSNASVSLFFQKYMFFYLLIILRYEFIVPYCSVRESDIINFTITYYQTFCDRADSVEQSLIFI